MTPERQRHAFQLAQKLAAQQRTRSALSGQNLGAIGESLYCYVPRRHRDVGIDDLLAMSYEDVASLYDAGSWAINDLIRLLERFADDAGAEGNSSVRKLLAMTTDTDCLFEGEFIHAVPLCDSEETESAASVDSPPLYGDRIPDAVGAPLLDESAACVNNEAMRAEFESMRQVLLTHVTHPLMDEELREFLEPRDTDIPTEFLGNSVREVLETPFERLARRWVRRERVHCLLNLLGRAVASIRSLTGRADENAALPDVSLRPSPTPADREIVDDGNSWRAWCDIIHEHGLQWLKLGTIAECLRDLSSALWDRPLSEFTVLTLRQVAEQPSFGPKKLATVTDPIRDLALDLQGFPRGAIVRLKLIPGPLRGVQDWIERVLDSGEVPSVNDVAIRLLRPLAWQLQQDLPEREARIAIQRLRFDQSTTMPTLEALAAEHGVSRERIRQLESWGPKVLQVRFPQGRYLLAALHDFLAGTPVEFFANLSPILQPSPNRSVRWTRRRQCEQVRSARRTKP